jgi:hypothetical protein
MEVAAVIRVNGPAPVNPFVFSRFKTQLDGKVILPPTDEGAGFVVRRIKLVPLEKSSEPDKEP